MGNCWLLKGKLLVVFALLSVVGGSLVEEVRDDCHPQDLFAPLS